MNWFKSIVESGVRPDDNPSKRRVTILSNYISLVLCVPNVLIFFLIPNNINPGGFRELMIGLVMFSLPLVLNRMNLLNFSRLYLSVLPPLLITWYMTKAMSLTTLIPGSTYDGLRIYLLATCCLPYLLMDMRNRLLFLAGVLPSFFCILFFEQILEFLQVGFLQKGTQLLGYDYNNARTIISYVIISGSCLSLKYLAEKSDERSEELLSELRIKNQLLREQAEGEVRKLNESLIKNLNELREREFVLNKSQQMAKIGSWSFDFAEQKMVWSEEMYDIYGVDVQFNIQNGREIQELYEPESRPLVRELFKRLRDGRGDALDLTVPLITPLGYRKWVRLTGYLLTTENGLSKIIGLAHDITLIKEAEERLRASERKYRSLFEQASDPILVSDLEGNCTDVNASMINTFGYTRAEFLQLNIRGLIDPTQQINNPIRLDLLRNGEQIFNERRMIRKDGTLVEVEANVKQFGSNSIMAIIRDVSEVRKIQRLIQENEARFRGAFDFSAIGMALVSLDGRWLKVNRQICAILGYAEAELLERTFQEITHPEDLDKDLQLLAATLRGDMDHYRMEKRYYCSSGEIVWVNLSVSLVRDSNGAPLYFVSQVEDITEWKQLEAEKERARYLLNERIKELSTVVRVSQILQSETRSVDETLEAIVAILPDGWQFSESAVARIKLGGRTFASAHAPNEVHVQRASFPCPDQEDGQIEMVYTESRPDEYEGPFLREERDLINLVAERLRVYFAHRHEAEKVRSSEANLNATINNTSIMVWTVDRDFRLLIFNETFRTFMANTFGRDVAPGRLALDGTLSEQEEATRARWVERYTRVLQGETFTLEDHRWDRDFRFSLSPVRQNNEVIGVAVFGEDITARIQQEQQLVEANKKIGELRLMALRSVMNPHFIFNALNSIQYFIAKNDRQNAINYLSTFSKLVRAILAHSITNSISLADEVEMLRHYINLELLRFENKFDYSITINPELDLVGIEIPSLVIQPFVENAILHGLYNKETKGELAVRIDQEDAHVVFEIRDNGIGRVAALELKRKNITQHRSVGSQLTEERLQLINGREGVHLEIVDLYTSEGVAAGTCVKIRIRMDV